MKCCDETVFTKNHIAYSSKICILIIINRNKDDTIVSKQISSQAKPWIHHIQPVCMVPAAGFCIGGKGPALCIHLSGDLFVVFNIILKIVLINEVMTGVVWRVEFYLESRL